ncbi:hypothetical protein D3C84_963750 [compost metagenome]
MGEPFRVSKGRIVAKNQLEIDQWTNGLGFVAESEEEVPVLYLADLGLVMGAGSYLIERNALIQIVHFHPAAKKVACLLVTGVFYAVRENFRQSVQELQLQGFPG